MLETVEAAGDTAGLAMTAAALGRVLARAERWDEAAEAFRRALAAEADVGQAAVSLTTRWARMRLVASLHTDAAYAMGRSSQVAWREALVTLERGRTRVLGDTFERDHRRLDALDRLGPDAVAARLAFLDAAGAMSALAGAELRSGGFGGSVPTAAAREEGRRARARLVEAKAAIQRFGGFESFLEPPDLEVIREAARGGPPLVHLWATEQGGFAVASVSSDAGEVRQIGIPLRLRSTEIDKMLFPDEEAGWPGLLVAQRVGGEALDPVLERILSYVGETVASPLRRLLWRLGTQRALLVLCGRLGALPILGAPFSPAEPRCLLDEFAIEITPSGSVAVSVRASRGAGGRTYVALADAQSETAPLPWAAAEVMGVAREAGAATPLVGEAATRERAVPAMRGADVVHLACHGVFELTAPERSRLALADGDLAVADVLSERVLDGVRLVVASACESGAADVTRLPDEATGLPAALLQAGAAHVLGTLWPVSDLSASLLVSRVAAACLDPAAEPAAELAAAQRWLRGLSRDEAVSQARALVDAAGDRYRDVLEDDVAWLELAGPELPFGQPRHWAPFVVVGA
jgi:CHAT domain-containing protein